MRRSECNVEEFERFYTATAPLIRAYLLRHCGDRSSIDDLFQTTYSKFLRSRMAQTPHADGARAYLYRIASNVIADHGRELQRATRLQEAVAEPAVRSPGTTQLENRQLRQALARLSKRDQQLLWLVYAEGFSHKEAASIMKLSQASIRVLLFRARKKLKQMLGTRENAAS